MNWNPYYRQEARREAYRAEEQEKERVLRLIENRLTIHRSMMRMQIDEDQEMRHPEVQTEINQHRGAETALEELKNAVRQGFQR